MRKFSFSTSIPLLSVPTAFILIPAIGQGAPFSSAGSGAWNAPATWTTPPPSFDGPQVGSGTDTAIINAGHTVTYANPINTGGNAATDWTVGSGSTVVVDGGTLNHNGTNNWSKIGSNTGGGATSTITIQNGGTFDNDGGDMAIGVDGGDGTMTITGAGSTYNHDANDFRIAWDNSTGVVNVADGASLTHNPNNWMFIGNGANSNGTLNISGAGSTVTTNADRTIVGDNATAVGVVNQSDGVASFAADGGDLFVAAAGTGTYNLTGGITNVGVSGSGNLSVGDQGGSTGVFNVNGATSTLNVNNDIRIGTNGTGTMTVDGGATVNHSPGGWFFVGSDAGTGVLNVDDPGTTFTSAPTNAYIGFSGNGTLNQSEGTVTFNADAANPGFTMIANSPGSTGSVNVSGGTLNIGDMTTDDDNLAMGTGTASLMQSGGTIMIENNFDLSDTGGNGVIMLTGGTMTLDDITDRDGSTMFGVDGTATLNADNILFNSGDGTDTFMVTGAGQTVNVAMNLDILNGDTFKFVLDGSASAFNPITVGGDTNLAGAMGMFDVSAWGNGWVPFMTELPLVAIGGAGSNGSAGIFENFGELSFVGAGGGRDFLLSRVGGDGNDLVLLVVPEPSRAVLLALGLGGLFLRRRR